MQRIKMSLGINRPSAMVLWSESIIDIPNYFALAELEKQVELALSNYSEDQ